MAAETSSSSTSTMFDTDSLSVGDDSVSGDLSETLPKRPRLVSARGRPRSGKFSKGWNMPFLVASLKGSKYACML